METFKEVVLTGQGFWWRHYTQGEPKRISPRSYRQGFDVGMMAGATLAGVGCLMLACVVVGWCL
jgi:hypothetical protein